MPHLISMEDKMWNSFQKGLFTDLVIHCGAQTFNVHKLVVCLRSKVFMAMCTSGFKALTNPIKTPQESHENTIHLQEEDVEVFKSALEFMYTGNYTYNWTLPVFRSSDTNPVIHHAQVYVFADKFDIPELLTKAKDRYMELLPSDYKDLRDEDVDIWSDIFESMSYIFGSTPESLNGLRDEILRYMRRASCYLVRSFVEEIKEGYQELLSDSSPGGFASCFLMDVILNPVVCRKCGVRAGPEYINLCQKCKKEEDHEKSEEGVWSQYIESS